MELTFKMLKRCYFHSHFIGRSRSPSRASARGRGGGGNWGGPGGRCSPPVPRGEGAGKVVHRPDDCRSIFNSQTVLSPRSLDSSSARRLNRNHHLMKEILSKTRKASKPGAAPCESSSGLVVGPPGCAKFSDGSADFVRLSTCCFL